jgi:coenzyme Q-binding protein COQ10
MPAHTEQQFLPYNTQQLFDMVADIERYPEFLPWCRAARITERSGNGFLGELIISFAPFTERYTSRVELARPVGPGEAGAIDVTMVKGPFEHLVNRWRFTPAEGGTQVDFFIDFKFRSGMLEKMIGSFFGKAVSKMVTAFKERAAALYGP